MTQEFNRQKLFENVSAIIQDRGLKIGDVESAVGISAGYLSRLSKKDSDASISADLVCKLAYYFGVSVDALLEGDFSVATDNTAYFGVFLNRLRQEVALGQQEWEDISQDAVDEILRSSDEESLILPIVRECNDIEVIAKRKYGFVTYNNIEGESVQCSVVDDGFKDWENGMHWCWGNRRVYSWFYPNEKVWLTGSGFKFILDDCTSMYLFKIMVETVDTLSPRKKDGCYNTTSSSGYELLFGRCELSDDYSGMHDPRPEDYVLRIYPICNTILNGVNLYGTVDKLYQATIRREKDLRIDKTVRASIDSYMKSNDGVPF